MSLATKMTTVVINLNPTPSCRCAIFCKRHCPGGGAVGHGVGGIGLTVSCSSWSSVEV